MDNETAIRLTDGALCAYDGVPIGSPHRTAIAAVVDFMLGECAEVKADPARLESMRLAAQWTERHESVDGRALVQTAGLIEGCLRNGVTA
jgi:hypothetical protein